MNKEEKKLARVVIFGRTNVGKSTLFNTLIEKQQALVSKIPGATRDSNINKVQWQGYEFELVDTAGAIDTYFLQSNKIKGDDIDSQVQKQVKEHLKNSDLILFVVDGQHGLLPGDKEINKILKKKKEYKDKTILVVNKIDDPKHRLQGAEFNKLAFSETHLISAASGSGTGDLLEIIIKRLKGKLKKTKIEEEPEEVIKVSIVGKPNVGKSSLLNALTGEKRVIVSPIAHTTREPQNTDLIYKNKKITIFDTAGMSRKGTKAAGLEKEGILKSQTTLRKSDIILLMLDINEEITHQDAKIIEHIVESHKSFVILANKWDMIEDRNTKKWTKEIYDKLPFCTWAPILFISAKHGGKKMTQIMDLILALDENRHIQLGNSQLNKFLNKIVKIHPPAKAKGIKRPRIYALTQTRSNPPKFEIRIGSNDTLHFSYVRFIENRLREKFGFVGTPLNMYVSTNRRVHGSAEGK